jgi:hypothetical protein
MIDEAITVTFEERFNERMSAYKHIAEASQAQVKAELFSSTRNIVVNRRLATDDPTGGDKWHDPSRMLFFPEDDCQSFVNTYNKSLDDTTLFKALYSRLEGVKVG